MTTLTKEVLDKLKDKGLFNVVPRTEEGKTHIQRDKREETYEIESATADYTSLPFVADLVDAGCDKLERFFGIGVQLCLNDGTDKHYLCYARRDEIAVAIGGQAKTDGTVNDTVYNAVKAKLCDNAEVTDIFMKDLNLSGQRAHANYCAEIDTRSGEPDAYIYHTIRCEIEVNPEQMQAIKAALSETINPQIAADNAAGKNPFPFSDIELKTEEELLDLSAQGKIFDNSSFTALVANKKSSPKHGAN